MAACKPDARRLTRVMVNPFAIAWLWRGFKGRSVTFAMLFATAILGLSLAHLARVALAKLGFHWLYVLILPMVLFSLLAKCEERFIPDEGKRAFYARSIIAGSILLALLIAWLRK